MVRFVFSRERDGATRRRVAVPVTLSAYSRPAFCEPQALGARGIIVEDVLLKSVKLPDQLTRVRTIHLCLCLPSATPPRRIPAPPCSAHVARRVFDQTCESKCNRSTTYSQVVNRNASACVTLRRLS